jgi:D-alanyl-D-alanine carboxypeptidase
VLTSFNNSVSNHPDGSVLLYQGALYGTTAYGGVQPASCIHVPNTEFGCGTIFEVALAPGASKSSTRRGGDPTDSDGGAASEHNGGTGQSAPPPRTDPDRIRKIVQAEAQKDGSKAVEFGMWVGDREVLTTALGRSMTEVSAATDMHYRIGGIAETFMSTLLLMLEEQGRINLDEKISRWFPHLLAADQVTPRMLVANTAGYIDYVTVDDFAKLQEAQPFRTFTDEELINYSVRDGKMRFVPSTSQRYSHTDNVILGQVIERATHESIAELYEKNIFKPMRMRDTSFPSNEEIPGPVLHAFTKERGLYEDCTYWNPAWGSTPGLPISNLHDIGKWGPILGTGRLISPAHFKEQIAPTSVGKGNNRPDLYFAYGFIVANGWIVQNPAINGYSGAFAYNMAKGVTITVEATKSEHATTDFAAFDILREVVKYVTPKSPIIFERHTATR